MFLFRDISSRPKVRGLSNVPTFTTCAGALAALAIFCLSAAFPARAESWESTVSPFVPGSFPEPRSLRARYNFGWSGFTAATGEIRFEKLSDARFHLEANGGTVGLVRTLWKYNIRHSAFLNAATLRTLEIKEVESIYSNQFTTDLTYSPDGVSSAREERKGRQTQSKSRRFDFPDVQSIISTLLFLRSQPLPEGAVHRVVVYPATSAYLSTIRVLGREHVTVPTGKCEAIKLDLQLSKIGSKHELVPHKKFRNATIWISNDNDRLVLRVKAQVFVGTVFAELQSVQFDQAKP